MKKLLLIVLLGAMISSCETEAEKKLREIETKIFGTLSLQARYSLTNSSTYSFERMKNYRVNDSIRVYIERYSGKNDYGIKKYFYTTGYFNMNNGMQVDGVILDAYTSEDELSNAKRIVEMNHPMSY